MGPTDWVFSHYAVLRDRDSCLVLTVTWLNGPGRTEA